MGWSSPTHFIPIDGENKRGTNKGSSKKKKIKKKKKRIRKVNFFKKNPNLTTKKKKNGGWEGRGWGVARVSDFF